LAGHFIECSGYLNYLITSSNLNPMVEISRAYCPGCFGQAAERRGQTATDDNAEQNTQHTSDYGLHQQGAA
jgi:hypothetical protein